MTRVASPIRHAGPTRPFRTLGLGVMFAVIPILPPVPTIPIDALGVVIGPPSSITAAHRFGVAVAVDDERLVVGADGRCDGPPTAGAVAIFRRTRDALPRWRLDRVVRAPEGGPDDGFGASLALDGDRLVVGAPETDARRGTAWLIELDDPDVAPRRLEIPESSPGDRIGETVAISGDLVVVGAPRADQDGCLDRGRVWCLELDEHANVATTHELAPPLSLTGLRFGASISIGPAIAIGATGADVPGDPHGPDDVVDRAGEVMLFARRVPFLLTDIRRRTTPGPLDRTGSATAWCEGILIAGSPQADCGSERGGIITVFGRPPSEYGQACRPDGGLGGRLSIGGRRLAATVPGRRGPDGRLDGSILVGNVDADGLVPDLELVSIARGAPLLDIELAPDGSRLAVGVARAHEDSSATGVVWVVEFTTVPVAAAAEDPLPDG